LDPSPTSFINSLAELGAEEIIITLLFRKELHNAKNDLKSTIRATVKELEANQIFQKYCSN
jgi:hypothetical protein